MWRGREQKLSASCRRTRSGAVLWPWLGGPRAGRARLLPLCLGVGVGGAYRPASGRSPCREGAWLPPGHSPLPWVVCLLLVFRGFLRFTFLGFCLFCCFLGLPPVSVETEARRRLLLPSTSFPTFPTAFHVDSEWVASTVK